MKKILQWKLIKIDKTIINLFQITLVKRLEGILGLHATVYQKILEMIKYMIPLASFT